MTDLTALNAARRTADLTALGDEGTVDVIVIGGGITGAGIALDAASRGLSTVLVRSATWLSAPAAGAPNWSTAGCGIWPAAISGSRAAVRSSAES